MGLVIATSTDIMPSEAQILLGQKWKKAPALDASAEVRFGSILLKKSFSTVDQNFSWPLMRFLNQYARDVVLL